MDDAHIGDIQMVAFGFVPRGWAACDGQELQIASHDTLFSLIGTTYGGDGRSTFRLPDLRGRVPIGVGQGPGLSARRLGETGGRETVALTAAELPAHTHSIDALDADANENDPSGFLAGDPDHQHYKKPPIKNQTVPEVAMHTSAISTTGDGAPHDNVQPFLTVNFCIALVGLFPS